jgi:hypothetical protein
MIRESYPIPDYVRKNQTGLKFRHLLLLVSQHKQAEGMGGRGSVFLGLNTKDIYKCTRYRILESLRLRDLDSPNRIHKDL